VERIMATMYDEDIVAAGLFEPLRNQFERNLATAAGMTLDDAKNRPSSIVRPTEADLPVSDIVSTYLFGTAFERLFSIRLPFAIPETIRFEHTHILAGSGHGKT